MKITGKVIFLIVFLLTFSGACMSISLNPFKKEVFLMSPLKGTLLRDGKPLANVEIEVQIQEIGGEDIFNKYTTDENGMFDIPATKKVQVVHPLAEFSVNQYVRAIIDGEKIDIWAAMKSNENIFGELKYPGEVLGLRCDLNDEKNKEGLEIGRIITICKWEKIKRI